MANVVAAVAARRLARYFTKLPISLTALCKRFDIELGFTKLNNINAYYMVNGHRRLIMVNIDHSLQRQRYSIAHELGHAVMRHGPVSFDIELLSSRPRWQEVHANIFAAELLMPKTLLARHGFLTPEQIMDLCVVSRSAATIRAEDMGWMQRELEIDGC